MTTVWLRRNRFGLQMSKGVYFGGSTTFRTGSNWFSYKDRKKKSASFVEERLAPVSNEDLQKEIESSFQETKRKVKYKIKKTKEVKYKKNKFPTFGQSENKKTKRSKN